MRMPPCARPPCAPVGVNCGPAGFCGAHAACIGACGGQPVCSSVACRCHAGFTGDGYNCTANENANGAVSESRAPPCFRAVFATSAGNLTIEAQRQWSPRGVDRLHSLLLTRFYDDSRVYRVVPGWVAQFGYPGSPSAQRAPPAIADDPVLPTTSNRRGVLSFSAAYDATRSHATNRTTELFISLADHPELDALGFSPVAHVVDRMEATVGRFFDGYGEMSDACELHGFTPCAGPTESEILSRGNAYLDTDFPRLTRIYTASLSPEACEAAPDYNLDLTNDWEHLRFSPVLLGLVWLLAAAAVFYGVFTVGNWIGFSLLPRLPMPRRVRAALFGPAAARPTQEERGTSTLELRSHDAAAVGRGADGRPPPSDAWAEN